MAATPLRHDAIKPLGSSPSTFGAAFCGEELVYRHVGPLAWLSWFGGHVQEKGADFSSSDRVTDGEMVNGVGVGGLDWVGAG